MTKVLIVAEHDGSALNPSTAKCVSCAAAIDGAEIDIVVLAADTAGIAAQAAEIDSVSRVLTIERAENEKPITAVLAPQIAALAGDYSHVLGPSTTFGKDLMPHVAALLGVNQVSDIMTVENSHTFKRPVYAGNAIVTVEAPEGSTLVATVRVASWQAASGGNSAAIAAVDAAAELPTHTRYISLESAASDRPDLQTASRVVAGGRALGSEEQFGLIYQLADALGAGVGASRAAVDAGYCPNELQVGQTGKIIAPDLYIAIGISGAIQHVTGIKDAGTIVAINKDEEAPIFEVADIGMVGDLFQILPELIDAVN
ncbi:MAG: electron transfer flavoprotein subunit alpha/FixB family protein [Gammaproteobacteria bacterium]|jgi:electron transfer flavoprotein alpha subunit|nr:electron transfer flavoprotein subunit alpha/FixB family protein [Gammaproteobacteria bacterium]